MVPVRRLTEDILQKRFSTLPMELKDGLTSDENLLQIERICKGNEITDADRILIVQQVVSLVFLGFLRTDDVSEELNDTGMFDDPKVVESIYNELNATIFSISKTLLDKNYNPIRDSVNRRKGLPVPAHNIIAQPAVPMPTIRTSVIPNPGAGTTPKMIDITGAGGVKGASTSSPTAIKPVPIPASTPTPTPIVAPAPQKKDLSAKGWAGMPALPSTPKAAAPIPMQGMPVSNIPAVPKAPAAPIPLPKPMSASAPAVPPPAPVILGGTKFSSVPQKNTDFHLSRNTDAEVVMPQGKQQAKIMPAVIEFSRANSAPVSPKAPIAPIPQPQGAIHYTEFTPQQPLAATPVATTGPRNVTEVTGSAPVPKAQTQAPVPVPAPVPAPTPKPLTPPMPPAPPAPPKPPMASMPSISQIPPVPQPPKPPIAKVITKDFL